MSHSRRALVTGCSSGIGLATVELLVSRGWTVVASARKPSDLQKLREKGHLAVLLDLADKAGFDTALAEAEQLAGGGLDALVNNAGLAYPGAVEDLDAEMLQRQFEVNFFGTVELTRRVLAGMRRRGTGRIVMVSSILGRVAVPWRGAYNASKFALEGITDTLRLELRGSGIGVCLVNPGPVKSRFRDNSLANFDAYMAQRSSAHSDTYARLRAETGARKDDQPFIVGPDAVAKKIARALECSRPRARYYVTAPAYALALARCILPDAWLDALLARI